LKKIRPSTKSQGEVYKITVGGCQGRQRRPCACMCNSSF